MEYPNSQAELFELIDGLRARGVRHFSGYLPGNGPHPGCEIKLELDASDSPAKPVERPVQPSAQEAREQARMRNLEDEFRHVGGAPPWLTKQVVDDVIEQDPGDDG